MANTSLPISEYVKQAVFIIIILAIAVFGIKSCRKYQNKRAIIVELTSHTSKSASYEQFYAKDAQSTLLKAMHQMHLAAELGMTPVEILQKVMEESEGLLDTDHKPELPASKQLIRDSLLSNYDNCKKLGIFSAPENIIALEKGELPIIQSGPATDEIAVIATIIPTSVLPGVDKLIPNLIISPPPPEDAPAAKQKLNNFEIARAKKFAESLASASLIEREAYKKVVEFYDQASENADKPALPPQKP